MIARAALRKASRRDAPPTAPSVGHNGGPPLDDPPEPPPTHRPPWGRKGIGTFFAWRAAHREAWKSVPREVALRRLEKAERLGLTYEEYTLEILERGRYLQEEDQARIAEIRAARRRRRARDGGAATTSQAPRS